MPTEPYSSQSIIKNAANLANAFRANNMPVFLVHVMSSDIDRLKTISDDQSMQQFHELPKDWADFAPELGPKDSDCIITKKQWGTFYGTDLDLQLRRRDINTIVLCGIATTYGVESTARFAYEFGYQQIFAEDAITDRSKAAHDNAVNFVLKRIGRIRKTNEILNALIWFIYCLFLFNTSPTTQLNQK